MTGIEVCNIYLHQVKDCKDQSSVNKQNKTRNMAEHFFSMEMNIYTINTKTTVTWHHDYYGCQGYKKGNNY